LGPFMGVGWKSKSYTTLDKKTVGGGVFNFKCGNRLCGLVCMWAPTSPCWWFGGMGSLGRPGCWVDWVAGGNKKPGRSRVGLDWIAG
jgi:hypothetical protein